MPAIAEDLKDAVLAQIDAVAPRAAVLSREIHSNPEVAFEAMALVALPLLSDPVLLTRVRDEFDGGAR